MHQGVRWLVFLTIVDSIHKIRGVDAADDVDPVDDPVDVRPLSQCAAILADDGMSVSLRSKGYFDATLFDELAHACIFYARDKDKTLVTVKVAMEIEDEPTLYLECLTMNEIHLSACIKSEELFNLSEALIPYCKEFGSAVRDHAPRPFLVVNEIPRMKIEKLPNIPLDLENQKQLFAELVSAVYVLHDLDWSHNSLDGTNVVLKFPDFSLRHPLQMTVIGFSTATPLSEATTWFLYAIGSWCNDGISTVKQLADTSDWAKCASYAENDAECADFIEYRFPVCFCLRIGYSCPLYEPANGYRVYYKAVQEPHRRDANAIWRWTAEMAHCPFLATYTDSPAVSQASKIPHLLNCLQNAWQVDDTFLEPFGALLDGGFISSSVPPTRRLFANFDKRTQFGVDDEEHLGPTQDEEVSSTLMYNKSMEVDVDSTTPMSEETDETVTSAIATSVQTTLSSTADGGESNDDEVLSSTLMYNISMETDESSTTQSSTIGISTETAIQKVFETPFVQNHINLALLARYRGKWSDTCRSGDVSGIEEVLKRYAKERERLLQQIASSSSTQPTSSTFPATSTAPSTIASTDSTTSTAASQTPPGLSPDDDGGLSSSKTQSSTFTSPERDQDSTTAISSSTSSTSTISVEKEIDSITAMTSSSTPRGTGNNDMDQQSTTVIPMERQPVTSTATMTTETTSPSSDMGTLVLGIIGLLFVLLLVVCSYVWTRRQRALANISDGSDEHSAIEITSSVALLDET